MGFRRLDWPIGFHLCYTFDRQVFQQANMLFDFDQLLKKRSTFQHTFVIQTLCFSRLLAKHPTTNDRTEYGIISCYGCDYQSAFVFNDITNPVWFSQIMKSFLNCLFSKCGRRCPGFLAGASCFQNNTSMDFGQLVVWFPNSFCLFVGQMFIWNIKFLY